MTDIVKYINVERPIRTVYNQWTQFEEFPRFMEGVVRVDQTGDDKLHWVIDIGGVSREFDAKVTEQIPDERIAWKSTDGKTHAGVVTFHRLKDDETRVTVQMSYDPEGFLENAADSLGVISSRVQGDLTRFKEFIEHQPEETGAWRGKIDRPGKAAGH
ncbi:MAG: SRPBCC family protein [Candidatus Binatia bacterium]